MASSEVDIVPSTPFGCVLRDHNDREYRYSKNNNSHACIQQNLKDLVHSCLSASPENAADSIMTRSQENKVDKRGVSSLVQKWRVFEAGSQNVNLHYNLINSSPCSSRSNSGSNFTENSQSLDGQIKNSIVTESVGEKSKAPSSTEESLLDSESERMCPSRDSNSTIDSNSTRDSISTENEKMRVTDIIKKLKSGNGEECNMQIVSNVVLPKVRTSINHLAPDIRGHGAISALPRIRRRKDFSDLLMQLERERHQEVQRLGERKAVSKFSHRGRLQAMLKVKTILHEKEVKDSDRINSLVSDRRKNSKGSSVMHLREKFNTGLEQNAFISSPRREMINNTQGVDKLSSSTQLKEAAAHTPNMKNPFTKNPSTYSQLKAVVDHTPPSMDNPSTPNVGNPSTPNVGNPSIPNVDNPSTPNVDNPFNSIQLKEVVDHTCSTEIPTNSTQHREETHAPGVTQPESSQKMVVDVTSNSTCSKVEDDVNQNINVVCPPRKSFRDIVHSWEKTHLRSLCKNQDVANETLGVEAWSTSERVKIDISRHDVINPQQNTLELRNKEIPYTEVSPNLDVIWKDTAFDTRSYKSQKSDDNATSPGKWKDKNEAEEKVDEEKQDTAFDTRSHKSQKSHDKETSPGEWKDRNEAEERVDNQKSIVSQHELVEDNPLLKIDWEEQPDREKAVETFPDWKSNFSQAPSEWEEDQSYQNMEESTLDWVYDVCRPRSDWECLRQERYQEMLDPFVNNGDIKQLLERKNVSSFLSSGLRDKIDQLMISRTQGQPLTTDDQAGQVKKDEVVKEEEKYAHEANEQEGAVECYPEREEEDESPEGRQHSEVDVYSSQTPSMTSASPYIFAPWGHDEDNNVSDDHVASPSFHQYLPLDPLRSNHPSIEMDLIFDLRGHMEQLHTEISDLRKSLHTCMEMQVKLQQSMMREAESVKSPPTQNKETGSIDRIPRKGTCCLCFDSEVDSLLYRCGHMCTCYKCAHELQQHSGICPICQAPILDVVHTYTS